MNKLIFRFLFTIFIVGQITLSYSQTNKIDQLRSQYLATKDESKQLEYLLKLCEQHFSYSPDSLFHYYKLAENIKTKSPEQAFRIAGFYCVYLAKTNENGKAIEYSDSLLKNLPSSFPKSIYHELLSQRCGALIRNNENKNAIENCFELLKSAEAQKDTLYILKAYTVLGWANMEIEKYMEGIIWMRKGISLTTNENILQHVAALFSNYASCYNNLTKYDSALYYVNKSLLYAEQSENLAATCNALNIRSNSYLAKKEFDAAEADMNAALAVREKIGDPFYIMADMGTLANYYAMRNLPAKGILISKKGIELARKTKNTSKLIFLYQSLAENYRISGSLIDYSNALEKIIQLKDTLYQENSEDAIAVLQTRYEVQKKENTILQQKIKIERNNYYLIGSTIVFILISLLIVLFYRNYQHIQKIKLEKLLQEEKILSREAVIKAEEAERKRIAADLHDNLGSYAAAISSNTKSIKENPGRATTTIIQLEENAQNMVTQLSDTIWVLKNEQLPFTSLTDRFKTWMQRLMKNYPEIKYYFNENIKSDLIFSPSEMLQLFLIMKECVTNSLKHSQANEITVNFYSDNEWKIEILDNGKGFNTKNYIKGSGLDNIMHRVNESKWKFNIHSGDELGTKINIEGSTTK